MDPYLEGDLWQEFHQRLANMISVELMPTLKPKYVALLSKYYVKEQTAVELIDAPMRPRREFYPDVHVLQTGTGSAAAAAAVTTPPTQQMRTVIQAPKLRVEIRDVAERRLVTVIEILSLANKVGQGAAQYNQKRADLLDTTAHLIEIDLLRAGARIQMPDPYPDADYFVYLNRAETRWFTSLWALQLPERLPAIPVPLLEPDPDVVLDLQAAFTASFDLVGYERLIDYDEAPPAPPFSPAGMQWIDDLLKLRGVRHAAER
jgi:hypothetical protein